jgi:penicillin-binding protein 2
MMQLRGGSTHGAPALLVLHRRAKWAALMFVVFFTILIGRLWQLQVLRGDGYYQRTVSNVVRERFLPSVRGKILDRNGVPLADNRPAFNIYVTPTSFKPEVRAGLARLLGLADEEIANIDARVAVGVKRDGKIPVMVLEDQGRDRAALVEQSKATMPGVEVHHEPYRYYPQGKLAAHLIGYMSQMTANEYDRLVAQGYDTNELVGRYGLESAWENYLRGKKGVERFAVDARGKQLDDATAATLISGPRVVEAAPGANLVLTIDGDLQKAAERAVAPHGAAAVAIVEIKTGRIRALVSRPSFDPNVMTGHLTRAEETLMLSDPRKPFLDKTVRATYPPGSVFKFVTTLAALAGGQAVEDESITCNGHYAVPGDDHQQSCNAVHGKLDLIGAIQHSCNVYFWELAYRIGIDSIASVARDYGFGVPTNLGINGDAAGRIPTKEWYSQRGRYVLGNATNAATGQGDVEVTVLQMAMAYVALANGGTLFVPQVVDRVVTNDGRPIVSYEPKVAHQIHTPLDALDVWRRGMYKVMNEAGGTGFDHVPKSDIVTILGKTGTAEVRKKKLKKDDPDRTVDGWNPSASHSWFAGWAPAEDPEIVIVVMIEHGGSGGRVATPIAKELFEYYTNKTREKRAAAASATTAKSESSAKGNAAP